MRYPLYLQLFLLWMLATPCLAETPPSQSTIEPQAVFKRLQEFAGSNVLDFKTTVDARSGMLGAIRGSVDYVIKRPNLFRIEVSVGGNKYALVSDGQVMTLYNGGEQRYTELQAPETPAEGLGLFTGLASVESQVLRLVSVIDDVARGASGVVVTTGGSEVIDGRQCDHFNVVENSDGWYPEKWEVWLESKDVPLPCKFVVSGSTGLTRDVQINEFSWKTNPTFTADMFKFDPPEGSSKVNSVGALGLHPPVNWTQGP